MLNTEARTVEEAYTSATNSSDLRVEADRRGDADVLIAAGWSMSRIGAALLRLHSEYDSAAHPPAPSPRQVEAIASTMLIEVPCLDKEGKPSKKMVPDIRAAQRKAKEWQLHETALMLGRLKAMPSVREQLTIQALIWGVADAQDVAAKLVQWWLSQVCPECHGTKYEAVAGTGRLSAKACRVCRGSGLAPIPCGDVGRRLANWMDECLHATRHSMGRRLRSSMAR